MRRLRSYVGHALDLAETRCVRDARYWARKALRIDSCHPEALDALGQVEYHAGRHELAIKLLDRAYMVAHPDGLPARHLPRGFDAQVSATAAKALATLRNQVADDVEREVLAERIMAWARIAIQDHEDCFDELARCPVLRDLQEQVRRLHAPWGVEP